MTKDEYVTTRHTWAREYLALSAEIRAVKHEANQLLRENQWAGPSQRKRLALRVAAREQMQALQALKTAAQQSYTEQKAEGVVMTMEAA